MSDLTIIIVLVLAVPVLWFVFKVIVGGASPKSFSGETYLKQLLQKEGFNSGDFSDECLTDLVDMSKQHAELLSQVNSESKTANFVNVLETVAGSISTYRADPDFPRADHIMDVLRKHNVKL